MKIIEIQNLSKSFFIKEKAKNLKEIEIFKNLNIDLEVGKSLAIVGPSGSGKSTLLTIIAGLDRPTSGKVIIDNTDLGVLNEKELTKFRQNNISIVFQDFHLFPHLTAIENIKLPLEIGGNKDCLETAQTILKQVGLSHRANHCPSQLSGGENQRVAIGRALITKPKILLADEPSGSLDTKTGEQVMDLLFNLVQSHKTNLILITHNAELASRCDQKFSFTH